jgi:hypothetical protein
MKRILCAGLDSHFRHEKCLLFKWVHRLLVEIYQTLHQMRLFIVIFLATVPKSLTLQFFLYDTQYTLQMRLVPTNSDQIPYPHF